MHVWLVCIHSHIHSIGYSSVKCIHYKWTGASSTVYVGHGYDVDVSIANYVPYCLRPNEISTKLLSHFPYSRNLSFAPSNPPTPPSFTLRKGIRLWTGGGGGCSVFSSGVTSNSASRPYPMSNPFSASTVSLFRVPFRGTQRIAMSRSEEGTEESSGEGEVRGQLRGQLLIRLYCIDYARKALNLNVRRGAIASERLAQYPLHSKHTQRSLEPETNRLPITFFLQKPTTRCSRISALLPTLPSLFWRKSISGKQAWQWRICSTTTFSAFI